MSAATLAEALESIQSLEARLEVEARTTWSLLSYLADLRFALGDDGRRMQDELLEYCRDLRSSKDTIQAALGRCYGPKDPGCARG